MNLLRKITSIALSACLTLGTIAYAGVVTLPAQVDHLPLATEQQENLVIAERPETDLFSSYTGTVTAVNVTEDGVTLISLTSEEKGEATFNMKDVIIVGIADIEVGDTLTGYYMTNTIMSMIYPAQYPVKVVVNEVAGVMVKVDNFDLNLVSFDQMLKLNLADDAIINIIDHEGNEFTGEIGDRDLVVVYTISTRSIPAITTPQNIIVLEQREVVTGQPYETEENEDVEGIIGEDAILPLFLSYTGTITAINEVNELQYLSMASEDKGEATFVIRPEVVLVGIEEFAIGDILTGYYLGNKPMIMIYPAQYPLSIVVAASDNLVKVDGFDADLLSIDGSLKLNVESEDIVIVDQNGEAFTGELGDRDLIVIYAEASKSYPAIATPLKIVVLDQREVVSGQPYEETEELPIEPVYNEKLSWEAAEVAEFDVVIADEILNLQAKVNAAGMIMLPLRDVCAALGYYDVEWIAETQEVIVNGVTLKIGSETYITDDAQVQIDSGAAALIEGKTYVPMSFFKDVLKVNNVAVFEGQIIVNNGEKIN